MDSIDGDSDFSSLSDSVHEDGLLQDIELIENDLYGNLAMWPFYAFVFFWFFGVTMFICCYRDVILDPGRHYGEWHTCNDPKLKGRFHWSCCDELNQNAECKRLDPVAKRMKEIQKQRPWVWKPIKFILPLIFGAPIGRGNIAKKPEEMERLKNEKKKNKKKKNKKNA